MYTERIHLQTIGTHASNQDLTSAAVLVKWGVQSSVKVRKILFVLKTATVSSGNIVVTFKRYPTYDSTSGAVSIGTVIIPTAAVAGSCYYKELAGTVVKEGEMVVAEVTTAAAGGGAAGNGSSFIVCDEDPETNANNANMVASA